MKTIELTQGLVATVDDEDFSKVSCFKWCKYGRYAGRAVRINGKHTAVLMHRFLWEQWENEPAKQLDHANGDPFDNRRSNVRVATSAQNCANRKRKATNTSGHTGVSFSKKAGKWEAKVDGGFIGYFNSIDEAVAARNACAAEIHGAFFRLSDGATTQGPAKIHRPRGPVGKESRSRA